MSRVVIERLTKRFEGKPPTVAVDDLTLEIEQGEFLVLLGPSGCGKTTTLRCLAGLESADEGVLTFGEQRVFDSASKLNLSPDRRSIGMVFQSYALWPHMTVRKNIAYPLQARKLRQGLAEGWVEEMAAVVDCGELLDRYPGQLSGGQQQRVALARGLVARPDLVLFDEPLSNLDARLREQVRNELAELHNRLGFTAVYVTHDQSEALALGDRLAIMRQGRIEQLGTPREVFASPTLGVRRRVHRHGQPARADRARRHVVARRRVAERGRPEPLDRRQGRAAAAHRRPRRAHGSGSLGEPRGRLRGRRSSSCRSAAATSTSCWRSATSESTPRCVTPPAGLAPGDQVRRGVRPGEGGGVRRVRRAAPHRRRLPAAAAS